MKKKALILSAIFVLFLIIGLWYNLTPGRYYSDDFWFLKDGAYIHLDNSIRPEGDGYALNFGGRELTARLSESEDRFRVDFSDGWAVEMSPMNAHIWLEVGGMVLGGDSSLILTDMDKANLRFGRVVEEVREPFYGGDGSAVGESVYRVTETGESVGWQEIWYDQPEISTPEPQTLLLEEGMRLTYEDLRRNLYINEDGEYLLNAEDAQYIEMSPGSWHSRGSVAGFLLRIDGEEPGQRGHIAAVFLYAFIYLLGAAQLLWPEQLAFFGRRWQFKNDPELSDEGLFMSYLSAVIVMVLAIVTLFIRA